MTICDNNTDCEFSIFSPTLAPNSAVSALGSSNITIDNVDIKDVTYGIFLASHFDKNTNTYKTTTSNVTINDTSISNSRREGLLLVGNDGVVTDNLIIDNSQQDRDMDLVVLQGSHDVTINNTNLSGGINGLMIVNATNLPSFGDSDINVTDMTINVPSRSGVFINPASGISLENVTINTPEITGLTLMGNDWMGGPTENISLTNFQVNNPVENSINFLGSAKNINGDLNTTQTNNACLNQWNMGSLEQETGNTLTINGKVLENMDGCN